MKKVLFVALSVFATKVAAGIDIIDAKVRLLPPGVPNTSAYMKIKNTDTQDRVLLAASSPVVKRVEIHNNVLENGVMKMQKQEKLILKQGETFKLQPGGYHLMLLGVKSALKAEQVVPITLVFQNGEKVVVKAEVSADIGKQHHHHH